MQGKLRALFASVDVKINGDRPWDIQVKHPGFYQRVWSHGSLGLGESYMDGWWECKELDTFFYKILIGDLETKAKRMPLFWWLEFVHEIKGRLINLQTKTRSKKVAKEHYDLSTEMYMSFLDPYNQYTCGYFKNTKDLNKAQEQKLDLMCKKLQLSSNDKVLDIGCGWGGFAKFAAKKYGCHVTGISISKEQIKFAREYCKGLPVDIIEKDYRDMHGQFDKVLVCGMIEHVGYKNYKKLFEVVRRCLKNDGLFLLHTIGRDTSLKNIDPWIQKYIFQVGMLPSPQQLTSSWEGLFHLSDWHNFGHYYITTLLSWHKNFNKNWHKIKDRYDERFRRMFKYYFMCSAGAFKAGENRLWQIVLSKQPKPGYLAVR